MASRAGRRGRCQSGEGRAAKEEAARAGERRLTRAVPGGHGAGGDDREGGRGGGCPQAVPGGTPGRRGTAPSQPRDGALPPPGTAASPAERSGGVCTQGPAPPAPPPPLPAQAGSGLGAFFLIHTKHKKSLPAPRSFLFFFFFLIKKRQDTKSGILPRGCRSRSPRIPCGM